MVFIAGVPSMRRAFTLIELLVVIGIIAVLVAITLVVGGQVLSSGKTRTTTEVIRQLTSITDQYVQFEDKPVPSKYVFSMGAAANDTWEYSLVDARVDGANGLVTPIESGARAIAVLRNRPEIADALKTLPSKFVEATDLREAGGNQPAVAVQSTRILDAWGRPIRFVHPAFDGGFGPYWNGTTLVARLADRQLNEVRGGAILNTDIRRSYFPFDPTLPANTGFTGDADEGICDGKSPYWYSMGEDGDAGTRADNVYVNKPRFPQATSAF